MRLTLGWPRGRAARPAAADAHDAIGLCDLGRLDDAAADAYAIWRQCSAALETAYARWKVADVHERGAAFGAYRAALDREQRAATRYAARFTRCVHARRRLHTALQKGRWS